MRAEGRRFEWMERISRPATRTGDRERRRRRRRESNKVTGASGFLRGKLLSPLRRLLRPRGESSDYDLPRSLLSLPSSAMKGKGSSSPRRFNVTAKDFTTRVKFQSALITFPRLLPRIARISRRRPTALFPISPPLNLLHPPTPLCQREIVITIIVHMSPA